MLVGSPIETDNPILGGCLGTLALVMYKGFVGQEKIKNKH